MLRFRPTDSLVLILLLVCVPACTEDGESGWPPSDDPDDHDVDTSVEYEPVLSEPRWVVPSDALPDTVQPQAANNNVGIGLFEDRLFVGFRSSEMHFASRNTVMYIVSSTDMGETWEHELTIALGTDVREPFFYVFDGVLYFTFFEAGSSPASFTPASLWRTRREGLGRWTDIERWGEDGEVSWETKERGGRLYMTSYMGNHYEMGPSEIDVRFFVSDDGTSWRPIEGNDPVVYHGGCSEAAWELDAGGALWSVMRNEDGDETGFGALLCHAPADHLGHWNCPDESDPERYDSPRMFRHGDEVYLVARRDIDGPYDDGEDQDVPYYERRRDLQWEYWYRPKRTALYRIDREAHQVVHLLDFPSAGDTAFPSIRRTGAHSFLIANYTSPVSDPDRTWWDGQQATDGTQIYLIELTFEPMR